jgi:hypothetical protein
LSATQIVERTVYTHTGWRRFNRVWAYLYGGGALGVAGAVTGVETSLQAALAPFIFPAPPTGVELRSAIRASLAVLDLSPDRVTLPTLGAVWRSILGRRLQRVRLWDDGPVQDRLGFPAPAALRGRVCRRPTARRVGEHSEFQCGLAFIAEDMLLVMDDFRPGAPSEGGSRARPIDCCAPAPTAPAADARSRRHHPAVGI